MWQDQFEKTWHEHYSQDSDYAHEARPQHAHNFLLILSGYYGFPAAILFLLLTWRIYSSVPANRLGYSAKAVIVAWIIAGCFENIQVSTLSSACGWLALALTGAWAFNTSQIQASQVDN
jgi:hypothetical protein